MYSLAPSIRVFLTIGSIFLHQFLCFAQQDITVSGVIVEQNSRYKSKKGVHYLQGAGVQINKGQFAISDGNGRFYAVISDVLPGSVLRIQAEKDGYEIVNSHELKQAAIAGRKEPLRIVMCPAGTLTRNRIVYYNIAIEAVEAQYQRQIVQLEADSINSRQLTKQLEATYEVRLSNKDAVLQLLKQQRNAAMAQAGSLSRQFAETNLDDADSLFVLAYEAFLEKRIDDVIRILDYDRLEQNILHAQENIQAGLAMQDNSLNEQNYIIEHYKKAGQGCRELFCSLLTLGDTINSFILYPRCATIDTSDFPGLVLYCNIVFQYHKVPIPPAENQYRNYLIDLIIRLTKESAPAEPDRTANRKILAENLNTLVSSNTIWAVMPQIRPSEKQITNLNAAMNNLERH
jgi:hypothetical protein